MTHETDIICIGSVLWDVIGRSSAHMRVGSDVPGRIVRHPGGVAMNIARALTRFGMRPILLTAVGDDDAGHELLAAAAGHGMDTSHVYVSSNLPTDVYMAVEGANGLIAAIADAHSLEAAGDKILSPLKDGRLGSADAPHQGLIVLDGNLTEDLLTVVAADAAFERADLRVAPASPGKAERLLPLLPRPNVTLYLNREEASLLTRRSCVTAAEAGQALLDRGASRVLVTDGANIAAEGCGGEVWTYRPPEVLVTRVTGAGDTFMAAHIAAEIQGSASVEAFGAALQAAAHFISGDMHL
ncbi:PfkB family carbohydrate kinase [Roseitranquillus sediminis]|uniref:PfkB family carbohydrate kinase n=1 Tax=Roseitranquillus sediminis TaxID=2809051 RepID=UPI001D0C2F1A|nr:PfkB family carbohydrate kinase [Roseitranquillus sediminis]MBM9595599.1 kinase [Roseitranquillus sediminis]